MTTYPDAEAYIRAVQEPERAFRVPALRAAVFELHPVLQIPMPASGSAAVVFKARVGGADQAMRFFIREDAASRERYTALGRYFAERKLWDCVASAAWIDDAITVNGEPWPMVQMHWVEGRTLDSYVGQLAEHGDVAALAKLATTWRALVTRLQRAEFAHGDLQHGNVLIDASSALRLVDFDGSWIAPFSGEAPPSETGHPNYQRAGREWGRWMDTFSGLVIYTALLGLSKNPRPWSVLHTGENLLFSHEDFAPPFMTRAWQHLSSIRDPDLDQVAERLKRCCAPGWRAEDSLEAVLTSRPSAHLTGAPTGTGPSADRWWELTGPSAAAAGSTLPPPRKMADDAPQAGFSTRGTGPSWYPHAGSGRPTAAPVPPAKPAAPTPRPAGQAVAIALGVAVVSGLVAAVAVSGIRGGPIAGFAVALVVFAIALALLLRRGRT